MLYTEPAPFGLTPRLEILDDDITLGCELFHEPFESDVGTREQPYREPRTLVPRPASGQSPRSSCSFLGSETMD